MTSCRAAPTVTPPNLYYKSFMSYVTGDQYAGGMAGLNTAIVLPTAASSMDDSSLFIECNGHHICVFTTNEVSGGLQLLARTYNII